MDIKEILEMLENAPETKLECKRIMDEIRKGPSNFDYKELRVIIIGSRMSGISQEQTLAIGMILINKMMKINGISEDEMMEYIRKFK